MSRGKTFPDIEKVCLCPGHVGFFITCERFREKNAINEAIGLLESVCMFPEPKWSGERTLRGLEDELKAMKKRKICAYPICLGNVVCMGFLQFVYKDISPSVVVENVWEKILNSGANGIKYCQKIVPIDLIVKTDTYEIQKGVEELLSSNEYFLKNDESYTEFKTFAVVYESRFDKKVNKTELIDLIVKIMENYRIVEENKIHGIHIDLKSPAISLLVQVIGKVCGLALIRNFVTKYQGGSIQKLHSKHFKCHFNK